MEYQQFINFLKRHNCYEKFLVVHSKYPNPSQEVYELSIIDIFKKFPMMVIPMCISFTLIYGKEGENAYIFWGKLHSLWMDKYLKK